MDKEKGILDRNSVRLALVYGCLALWIAAGYLLYAVVGRYDSRWIFFVGVVLFAGVSFILPDGKKDTWRHPTRRSTLKVMAFFLFGILNASLMGNHVPGFIRVHVEVHSWLLLTPVLVAVGFYYLVLYLCRRVNPKKLPTGEEGLVEVEAVSVGRERADASAGKK